jgi:phage terminase small subunit
MASSNKLLTALEDRFVKEILIDGNATEAAKRSGYSAKTAHSQGSRLLKRSRVARAIEAARKARSEATGIDAEWVLLKAKELFERCMQDVRPALDKRGRPIKDDEGNVLYRFDSNGSARALEIIGRHVAVSAFEENINVNHLGNIVERLNAGRARAAARNRQLIDVTPAPALPAPRKGK